MKIKIFLLILSCAMKNLCQEAIPLLMDRSSASGESETKINTEKPITDLKTLIQTAESGDAIAQYKLGKYFYSEKTISEHYKQATVWLDKSARQGNKQAQYYLAYCLKYGKGIQTDTTAAFHWLNAATAYKTEEKKDPKALSLLAMMHFHGEGTIQNNEKAFYYFNEAAKLKYPEAINNVAHCYEKGFGTKKNYEEAIKKYQEAIKYNYIPALHNLGMCYIHGYGVPQDNKEALKYIQQAARKGFAESQYFVATCYEQGIEFEINLDLAIDWFSKAAAQNYRDAHEKYRKIQKEYGKALFEEEDYKHALAILTPIAQEEQHADSAFLVGLCHYDGLGTTQNNALAFKFFQIAATKNIPEAIYYIGLCHRYARGTDWNERKAFTNFLDAARSGLAVAQFHVGYCYETGSGIMKNITQAQHWYLLAAQQGYEGAQEAYERVSSCSVACKNSCILL